MVDPGREPDRDPGVAAPADLAGADAPSIKLSDALTWPNVFTLARLIAIPVFVWLLFGRHNRAAAAWLLGVLGATDWVDGWLARRLDQATELGAQFDPIVDRLLFFVAIPCLIVDGSVPVVVAVLVLAREALVSLMAVALTIRGADRLQVTWEGKTGTFFLMFGLPMFLGAESTLSYAPVLAWLAWVFTVPGLGYGWFAALYQYLPTTVRAVKHTSAAGASR
jgi:cardiolipin synthase